MENLIYWYKPYLFFVAGFLCGQLDHPIKWVSVVSFLVASLIIEYWRYVYRDFDFERIKINGVE